jgi:LuxR family maltose regulon positive regulatory protein
LFRGDIQTATEALENFERAKSEVSFTEKIYLDIAALHVELAQAQEDYDALNHWLEKFAECDFNTQQYMFHPIAVNLFNQKWPEEGKKRLDILEELYRREGMDSALLHIYVARALLATDDESALSFIAKALKIGKPQGAVRWFVDTGISLAPLLRKAISKRIEPEFCRKILSVMENEERQRKIRKGETPLPPESILSERELEVLRLILEGFTNQQITEKLFITISTTKAHVRHIYDKLGVNNRTQALSRAKNLNIL